jgi:hypothetical protein
MPAQGALPPRGSYDLDFSIPDAFKDVDEISRRIFAALKLQPLRIE